MSAAASPIEADVIDVDELENVSGKNHRPLDDIWQYYKKIKLPFEQAAKLHRHYDATCKGCGDRVSGKPQLMRKHTSKCTSTPHTGQLHALREQAKAADSNGSNQSGNQSASEEGPSKGLDRVIKSCTVKAGEEHLLICQKAATCFPNVRTVIQRSRANKGDAKLPALLKRQHEQSAITSAAVPVPKDQEAASINAALLDMLVMCNVSLNTVDSAWFRRFCGTIRPGFVPLCVSTMRTTALDSKLAKVCIGIKQLLKAIKFSLLSTLTLDGWTNINEQLIIVLEEFGPENFGAVVSDNGGGCENGRKLTKEKYPHLAIQRFAKQCIVDHESKLADAGRYLILLARTIKALGTAEPGLIPQDFTAHAYSVFNRRWLQMATPLVMLALFLHPGYRVLGRNADGRDDFKVIGREAVKMLRARKRSQNEITIMLSDFMDYKNAIPPL
ncbi:TPA: hypothetical protein ACH3X1_016230 [Trebouxia sp. C0004]